MSLTLHSLFQSKKSQIFILITLTTIVYINSFSNSFHFDDKYAILGDRLIRSLHNLPAIFSDIFRRPILRATFALNYHFGGLNVFGYHLFNLILHIVVAIEVYFLAELLSAEFLKKDDTAFPFLSSLIFAIHPLHTGSVTYIASRSAVLATAFFLLSFILFLKGLANHNKKRVYYLLSIGFFILSFGTKEIVVTLPLVITVYACLRHNKDMRSFLKAHSKRVLPFFIVLAGYLLARKLILTSVVPVDKRIYEDVLPPYQYFLTQLNVIVFYYLRWLLLPLGGPNVDPDIPAENSFFDISTVSAAIIIIALLITAYLLRRKQPIISFGILWYFITLLPTSSIFPLGDLAVERHVYLPSVGFSLIAGFLLARLRSLFPLKAAFTVYICLFLFLGYLTVQRNSVWKTELTLWEDAAKKSPNKVRVLNNRAYAYIIEGDLDKAEYYYRELLKRFPEYPYGHNNLGTIYQIKGRLTDAIKEFEIAVKLRPTNPLFRLKLGIAYEKAGQIEKAIREMKMAVKLAPSSSQALTTLASALAKAGRFIESIDMTNRALRIEPANPMAYYILGYSYEQIGEYSRALNAYQQALKLKPGWPLPHKRMLELSGKMSD